MGLSIREISILSISAVSYRTQYWSFTSNTAVSSKILQCQQKYYNVSKKFHDKKIITHCLCCLSQKFTVVRSQSEARPFLTGDLISEKGLSKKSFQAFLTKQITCEGGISPDQYYSIIRYWSWYYSVSYRYLFCWHCPSLQSIHVEESQMFVSITFDSKMLFMCTKHHLICHHLPHKVVQVSF